jgi:hypothetical protein
LKDGYVDQNPDSLRLTWTRDPIDRDQFSVYASCTMTLAGLHVSAAVIGASHIITYSAADWQATEVFACVPVGDLAHWTLDELTDSPIRRKLGRGSYEFTIRRVPWEDPEPPDLIDLVEAARSSDRASDRFGLVQEFPTRDLSVVPKTVIFGHAEDDRRVVIETAHSYPNVRGLVMSRTTLHHTT